MFDTNKIFPRVLKRHELNNQGCRCLLCQQLIRRQNMEVEKSTEIDRQSQHYSPSLSEEYSQMIFKFSQWEKYPRKIRFALPEICLYDKAHPICFISKRKENGQVKVNRDQSKMHMFEVIRFLLEGFVYHNPFNTGNNEKSHNSKMVALSKKYKNECVVLAKYKNNQYHMLTLIQLEALFKSQHKYLREGLMYLQTLVSTKEYKETRIRIDIGSLLNSELLERAKKEIKMIMQQIKSTSMEYVSEQDEIAFENQLRQKDLREFLQYLSMKIIFLSSKHTQNAISEAIFKYVCSKDHIYLWDIRVIKMENTQKIWVSGAMKAFEYKLSKRMSMMDFDGANKEEESEFTLSSRGVKMVQWLERSTSQEWGQMQMIRARLQKLEREKKSLMQSQSFNGVVHLSKSFKIRPKKR